MDPVTAKLMSAAGAAADKVYVDDVFSTFLYNGTGSTAQTINNGIDLSGEGGMVWIKDREASSDHAIYDTERGVQKLIKPNQNYAEDSSSSGTKDLYQFNSNGFSIGEDNAAYLNTNNNSHCSWTFRKAPGFFDVVTYTGNGTAGRTIAHDLGSVPGVVIIKRLEQATQWRVYHRSLGNDKILELNDTAAAQTTSVHWNGTDPTSTDITLGTSATVNGNGSQYVAYIFAHDDQSFGEDGDKAIIKCGSYTGNGGTQSINVGFEPQFLITKRTDNTGNWFIHDVMRKFTTTGTGEAATLRANQSTQEYANTARIHVNSNGFNFDSEGSGDVNASSGTYIYIAIRRPHKPPEAGTEVFAIDTQNSGSYSSPPYFRSGFAVDAAIRYHFPSGYGRFGARQLGDKYNLLHDTSAASSFSGMFEWDYNNGFQDGFSSADANTGSYMFKRAPKFFDVVAYTGTGSSSTQSHNLGVDPELAIIKSTSASGSWIVGSTKFSSGGHLVLDEDGGMNNVGSTTRFVYANWSSTVLAIGSDSDVNASGTKYVTHMFATLPGISKVASYTGTGNNINVDCGFTAGARFVMIKRTDSSGDWYVWDSLRGIVSGNDPYVRFNEYSAQVTNTDYIDPLNAGFTVTSSAPAAINTSGGTYLFLAIA